MNDEIVKKVWLSYLYGFITACEFIVTAIHINNTNAYDWIDLLMILNIPIFISNTVNLIRK